MRFTDLSKILKEWNTQSLLLSAAASSSAIIEAVMREHVQAFAFTLQYCEPPDGFDELSRYVMELDECSGRRGAFQGTVIIDCTQWSGSESSAYFDAFAAYLHDHQAHLRYIFILSQGMPHQQMLKKLSTYFSISCTRLSAAEKHLLKTGEERK